MRAVRLVTAGLVAGSAGLAFLPLAAHADTSRTVVVPSVEAWYQPNPTCGAPVGCVDTGSLPAQPPVAVPLSPYPSGTLHVGYDAGQETARTYLAFTLPFLDARLTGATLDVPLDVAQADGSVAPETAKLQVCPFGGALVKAEGSIATPPRAECSTSAPATYVATPSPHLHADLSALLEPLASSGGVALLPDASKNAQTDAWHVVFSAHDRTDAAKTAPATLSVTLAQGDTAPEAPAVVPPAASEPVAAPPVTGPVGVVQPAAPVQPVAPVTGPVQQQPVALPQARTVTVGYAYPAVWLLPLAFLLGVPAVARALTRDLTPASP